MPHETQSGGWQPIETAPRDGTEILVYEGPCAYWLVRWYEPESGTRGWETEATDAYGGTIYVQAAWWMPLPAPPEATHAR